MTRSVRGFLALLAAGATLTLGAAPALAFKDEGLAATERHVPPLVDALILRPFGLMMTVTGAVVFAPTAAIVGITRPTDLGKPFKVLVGRPFRFTFMDPLGEHSPSSVFDN